MAATPTSTTPASVHPGSESHGRSPATTALTRAIAWYQVAHQDRPSPCRFVPSCSTYAQEAIVAHGAIRGSALAARRLLRCHPWGGHGFDPVPPAHERVDQRV